jgi:hypothetical protein
MAGARKIAAILAADVVGFSRLAGADEDCTGSSCTSFERETTAFAVGRSDVFLDSPKR